MTPRTIYVTPEKAQPDRGNWFTTYKDAGPECICYTIAQDDAPQVDTSDDQVASIAAQARELGFGEAAELIEALARAVVFQRKCQEENVAKIARQKTALKQMQKNLAKLTAQNRGVSRRLHKVQRSGDDLAYSQYADVEARLINQRGEIDRLRIALEEERAASEGALMVIQAEQAEVLDLRRKLDASQARIVNLTQHADIVSQVRAALAAFTPPEEQAK